MGNDITYIIYISLFFIVCGLILPYVAPEVVEPNFETLENDVQDTVGDANNVSGWKVVKSVISIFFWSFGSIPFWLDITLFLLLRIALVMFIARNIWIGGGS